MLNTLLGTLSPDPEGFKPRDSGADHRHSQRVGAEERILGHPG